MHEPRAELRGIVRCIWRHFSAHPGRRLERIPPDGCPEIIVNLGAAYSEVEPDGSLSAQPDALFAGQLTRPLTLVADGAVDTIRVRFEPCGARGFLGASMTAATDRRIALDEVVRVGGGDFLSEMRRLDDEGRRRRLELIVLGAMANVPPPDEETRRAVRALDEGGCPSPKSVSLRQLQRRFRDAVGVSMREYQSILRFRRVFDAIESEPDWARSAVAAGYFDQSQMARDFRRYLGCTASEWARQRTGLSAAIAAEASQTYKRA
jgi:hypothetical protein